MPRTEADLVAALQEQAHFLHSSCVAYDRGSYIEAKRLSVSLRLLFHQTRGSRALMGQLEPLDSLRMYNTARARHNGDGVSTAEFPLVYVHAGFGGFVPALDDDYSAPGSWVDFETWWHTPVLQDQQGFTLTRETLVLAMANEDGGAHVDPIVSEAYARILTDSLGFGGMTPAGQWAKMRSPVFASVRQVAHECLITLAHSRDDAFPETVPREQYGALPALKTTDLYGPSLLMGGTVIHVETMDGEPVPNPLAVWPNKIGRNEPCPCGSGSKYKKCHGC